MKIGIVVLCTNAYFVLGIRFIKRFIHHYKGDKDIVFYIFTDKDPKDYLPDDINYRYHHTTNKSWVDGTNLKFTSILKLENCEADYLFYFDADTSVDRDFTEEWFLGDMVGGQHYGDQGVMLKEGRPYDRNPRSKAYIPYDTKLSQVYYYGAFFGGKRERVMEFCKTLVEWQIADKKWGYEPGVNDESYIQKYFHYNPPKMVKTQDFKFVISHKGGIGDTRIMNLDVKDLLEDLLKYKNEIIDIQHGKVTVTSRGL